jgi:hypothetical protein
MTGSFKKICECDLRHRAWNPNTCGSKFEDRREFLRTREEKSS